jgi:hypothetical protein
MFNSQIDHLEHLQMVSPSYLGGYFTNLLLKITGIGDEMGSNTELIDVSDASNAAGDLCPIYNTE